MIISTTDKQNVYLLKVNNRNTRARCEIVQVNKKTSKRRHWRHSDVFIVDFEHISDLPLELLLLTVNIKILTG